MNNNQNMNSDKTSVKVHNPPGGQSSFSLGGGYGEEPQKKVVRNPNAQSTEDATNDASKTSVKVHQQPGGNSNFSLGGNYNNAAQTGVARTNPNQSTNNIFGGYEEPKKQPQQQQQQQQAQQVPDAQKTSVKVHNPPGGRSNFTLG